MLETRPYRRRNAPSNLRPPAERGRPDARAAARGKSDDTDERAFGREATEEQEERNAPTGVR